MTDFAQSYLGGLRRFVGTSLLMSGGARVLMEDDQGRFLILLDKESGTWGVPSGGMEPGESLLTTAARELHEETGLTLVNPTPFALTSDPATEIHVYPHGDQVHYISLSVHAYLQPGETVQMLDGEIDDYRFVTIPQALALTFNPSEALIFTHWDQFKTTGQFFVN